jgi:hypothetical protein
MVADDKYCIILSFILDSHLEGEICRTQCFWPPYSCNLNLYDLQYHEAESMKIKVSHTYELIDTRKEVLSFATNFRKCKNVNFFEITSRHIGEKWLVSFASKSPSARFNNLSCRRPIYAVSLWRETQHTKTNKQIRHEFQDGILSVHFWRMPSNKNRIYMVSPHYVCADVFADLHSERNLCHKHYTYMASHLCALYNAFSRFHF